MFNSDPIRPADLLVRSLFRRTGAGRSRYSITANGRLGERGPEVIRLKLHGPACAISKHHAPRTAAARDEVAARGQDRSDAGERRRARDAGRRFANARCGRNLANRRRRRRASGDPSEMSGPATATNSPGRGHDRPDAGEHQCAGTRDRRFAAARLEARGFTNARGGRDSPCAPAPPRAASGRCRGARASGDASACVPTLGRFEVRTL